MSAPSSTTITRRRGRAEDRANRSLLLTLLLAFLRADDVAARYYDEHQHHRSGGSSSSGGGVVSSISGGGGRSHALPRCYSCMSRYYAATWQFAGYDRIWLEPRAFTDQCAHPARRGADVPAAVCDRATTCVSIVERLPIGVGAVGYIRGCYSLLAVRGFNRSYPSGALAYSHDFCLTTNLTQLVASAANAHESRMRICSCTGDLCNGVDLRSSTTASYSAINGLSLALVLLGYAL